MSVVGIDLGTTNTVTATARNGRVQVLADEHGEKLLPSVVSFHPNGDTLVGRTARDRRAIDVKNTIYSVKRLLGRPWQSAELEKARGRFPFELAEGPAHSVVVKSRGREFSLPEISGIVLKRARANAEAVLKAPVERAVVTVPAHFNELQRSATKVAARVAGLEVLRILNEPTAAALAYGLGRGGKERIAVYDFGGGTFDCTLLDLSGNIFEVLATAGDTFLGGDDIDNAIASRMAEAFMMQHRYDVREDPQAFERLRIAAETLKQDLSTQPKSQVRLRELAYGAGGAHLELSFGMTRDELDALVAPLIDKTIAVCQDALSLAGMDPASFDKVILVGGSTRIPRVKLRVESFFGRTVLDRINPDEIVGVGAAIQAAALGDVRRSQPVPPPPLPRRSTMPPPPPAPLPQALGGAPDWVDPDPTETGILLPADFEEVLANANAPELSRQVTRVATMAMEPTVADFRAQIPAGSRLPTTTLPLVTPLPPPGSSKVKTLAPPPLSAPPPNVVHRTVPLPPAVPGASTNLPVPPSSGMFPPPPTTRRIDAPPSEEPTVPRSSFRVEAALTLDSVSTLDSTMSTTARMEPQAGAFGPASGDTAVPTGRRRPSFPPPVPDLLQPSPRAPSSFPPSLPSVPPVLLDVAPRALLVETVGGYCDTIIPRNAKIPCERTRAFATSSDMQTAVRVRVAQGESLHFAHNVFLGEVELSGLRAAPRGDVRIAVTFAVDSDGTLQVTAADIATERQAFATLKLIGGMSAEQIQQAQARVATLS